jgi:hypothetical protein
VALHAEPPHVALSEDLWAVLAYETDDRFVRIEAGTLRDWKVSFDAVWPAAVKRLEERSRAGSTHEIEGARELRFGDGNDSARVLVPSALAKEPLTGGVVAAMPNEALLLLAGAGDPRSLDALAGRLLAEWDRGNQNARVVRVSDDGKVAPLVLDASSPEHARLLDLQRSTEQREERLQREALRRRLGDGEDAPFVASLFRVRNRETGAELSFVVHSEEVTSLLPRADYVVWKRVDMTNHTATTLACAPWSKAYPLMKPRWKETPLHPARWLAATLPTDKELKELGCDQPMLRGEDRTGKTAP